MIRSRTYLALNPSLQGNLPAMLPCIPASFVAAPGTNRPAKRLAIACERSRLGTAASPSITHPFVHHEPGQDQLRSIIGAAQAAGMGSSRIAIAGEGIG